jgi:ADP-heptose:LPS heptosyltransferase
MAAPMTPPPGWLQRHAPDQASIAVFRALHLGDMLCAVPALRALRTARPEAHIALVGLPWAAAFVQRFAHLVDEFIGFPGVPALPEQAPQQQACDSFHAAMRSRGFDVALQMHGSGDASNPVLRAFGARACAGFGIDAARFPALGAEPLRLLYLTTLLGAPTQGSALEFPLTAADQAELDASGVAAGLAPRSYLCIHPGARTRDKCWPVQRFADVADALAAEFGLRLVLTGAASDADLCAAVAARMHRPAIDATGLLSIGAMAALMARARLLICNDTGVSHIAAGLGLPSVVIFSKADIRRWAPLDRQRHRCLWDPEGARAADVLAQARLLLRTGAAE